MTFQLARAKVERCVACTWDMPAEDVEACQICGACIHRWCAKLIDGEYHCPACAPAAAGTDRERDMLDWLSTSGEVEARATVGDDTDPG